MAGYGRLHGVGRLGMAMGVAAIILTGLLLGLSRGNAEAARSGSGFEKPYVGSLRYERLAPKKAVKRRDVNRPLGIRAADRIARAIGLKKSKVFTRKQYALFVSGKGVGGEQAPVKLVNQSVRILTNTAGRPLVAKVNGKVMRAVLGSYGLMISTDGMLQSPANQDAPTRQVNSVIEPGGYLGTWCRANGAQKALRQLYRSAYTPEAVWGNKAQQQSGVAQLVPNRFQVVGMSMAPSIWIVNFALIYTLNPNLAAKMPAYWTPIPANVALAIAESPTGQVPYSQYKSSLPVR